MFFRILSVTLLVIPAASGQERAATGSVETQVTWTALRSLVDQAKASSDGAHARIDQIGKCGGKGMLYAPTAAGKDADGCLAIGGSSPKMKSYSYYGTGNWGGAGEVHAGWHTFCTLAFHHDRTNHWLNITSGPNADGKFYWVASRAFPGDSGTSEPRVLCVD